MDEMCKKSQIFEISGEKDKTKMSNCATLKPVEYKPTFCCFIFNGLFEKCDVSEGAEEKHHLVVFIFNGGHLHVKPYRCPCRRQLQSEHKRPPPKNKTHHHHRLFILREQQHSLFFV